MIINKIFKITLLILLLFNVFLITAIISYKVTLKGEMVSVPDLIGKTYETASLELSKRKLFIEKTGDQLHEYLEKGKIVSQDPPLDSKIKINKIVKVIISAGKEKVIVPKLIGKNRQNLNPILSRSNLRIGKVSHVHTSKYAAGQIICQYPLENQEVPKNTKISILVSQGEKEKKYLMPDLIGKRASVIITKLRQMEFNLGDIRSEYYPGYESGVIIKQSPPQGYRIQKRNLISLEVSK